MIENQMVGFGPYCLELGNSVLWRDNWRVKLTRQSFQVFCYLAQRPGRLVTKSELFQEIWPQVVVGDAALSRCIQEIRRVCKENARAPKYIETVHGQGYRFIGTVVSSQHSVDGSKGEAKGWGLEASTTSPQAPSLKSLAPSETKAEACFLKAIEVAQRQQAKSWELRATMSLARLWQWQGKRHEAYTVLTNVYNWFTEGFDTADLKDAKALLRRLSEGA